MDAINKPVTGDKGDAGRSPEQLSFIWGEPAAESPTALQATPGAVAGAWSGSDKLIEIQTRLVKAVFFTILGIALVAVHYFDR